MVSVLIVEDERLIARDLAEGLRAIGHVPLAVATSYDEAVRLLQSEPVELAIIDIEIDGERDGIALGAELREEYEIPFVFLTSHFDRATVSAAAAVRPNGYLTKPFDMASLDALIETARANFVPGQRVDYARLASAREGCAGGLSTPHRGLVERWIARRIGGSIRIAELAALCGLSVSSFQRAFRASFGQSAHAYITAQRVAEAKRLLRNTDWAISEVASACGFSGQAHFTTVFRLHTGTTPARHRHAL